MMCLFSEGRFSLNVQTKSSLSEPLKLTSKWQQWQLDTTLLNKMHVNCCVHETLNCLLILSLIYSLIIRVSRAKSIISVQWDLCALMLVSFHVKVLKHLLDIVGLVHVQSPSLAVVSDLNVKNFLHLPQVLDFESCSKRLLESGDGWDCCRDYDNVINIEKQHDVLLTMKQKAWVDITLMKSHLDQFSNTSFVSVSCGLLQTIQTAQYVQSTVWSHINIRRWCHVDDLLEKWFSECIVHIHLMAFQVLKCDQS